MSTKNSIDEIGNFCLMTGNANPALAQKIAEHMGVKIFDTFVGRFNNGESQVMIGDSIRGKDIFIIQPTSQPVNDNLMDLLVMADACKRASAHSITAVVHITPTHVKTERPAVVNLYRLNSLQI